MGKHGRRVAAAIASRMVFGQQLVVCFDQITVTKTHYKTVFITVSKVIQDCFGCVLLAFMLTNSLTNQK